MSIPQLIDCYCKLKAKVQELIDKYDAVEPTNTGSADKSSFIQSTFTNADIHDNGALVQFAANTRVDAGWSRVANVFSYTGAADAVIGRVALNAPDGGDSNYWARPKLRVLKGGAVIAVIDDLVMQQNGAYDGDATINGSFVDAVPGGSPAYTFEWFDDDARLATLPPESYSNVTLQAIEKITVLTP